MSALAYFTAYTVRSILGAHKSVDERVSERVSADPHHVLEGPPTRRVLLAALFLDWPKEAEDEQWENRSNPESDESCSALLQNMAFGFLGKDAGW